MFRVLESMRRASRVTFVRGVDCLDVPVVNVARDLLVSRLDERVEDDRLARALAMMGCVPEETDGREWAIEVFPDRPDLLSGELLARGVRAYLGQAPGLVSYEVGDAKEAVVVDGTVGDVRPFIVGGRVRGVSLDEERLTGLMNLQEDLHWGLGARRRKVSVGLHDAGELSPPYTYEAVDPDEVSFVPLRGADEMTMRAMLKELEKGAEYAHLVEGHDAWPLITDDEGQVLSFPPIINGTLTTVTEETEEVFVDVTGTDERACRQVLTIVMAQLAELGGRLEAVSIEREGASVVTPDLSPSVHELPVDRARSLLGTSFSVDDTVDALERMGHGVEALDEAVRVEVGAWRADVLHPVDLVEDVAIGLGYDRFEGCLPEKVTFGDPSLQEELGEQVRRVLTGLGYLECMTLTLTSEEEQVDRFGVDGGLVAVENPVSGEHAVLRGRLLPSLLGLAAENTHRDVPQRLFEVGDIVEPVEGGTPVNRSRAGGLVVASDAGFTKIKAHVEALMRALGVPVEVEGGSSPGLVQGRAAFVLERGSGTVLGEFGEVDPSVLEAFGLEVPCAGFEVRLDALADRSFS